MSSVNFIDYVKFNSRSGHGGAGCRHFHQEKFIDKGGPDGGDGGRGGHVILRGNSQMWTLLHLKYRKHVFAENGQAGQGQNMTGAFGKDQILDVPLGTTAKRFETGELVCEITEHGQEIILSPGGRGGKGNAHFATPTNQAPQHAQTGEPGRDEWIILELRLLADVGLVGFPNAGKSTLLSVVSAARPKIADYAFTTLTPNLGVVAYRDGLSFVMADIPGIIEGAAEGRGLGIRFLKHIERNSLLLFMVAADAKDIKQEFEILLNELKKYNPELLDKKRLLAITKSDLLDEELRTAIQKELPKKIPTVFISALANQGISELKDLIWKNLH
ncbi:MAG: GTPase ObgE [Cyclobacteriaceae bacterium]|nr:GTPase ObgE [Cyclobacteriaceae bacterium]